MTTLRILTKTESYVVCSTTAQSSHYLALSSELLVWLLTCSAHYARPTHFRSTGRVTPLQVERASDILFTVASTKQLPSIVPKFKPFTYDTSLSTLSKVQDKPCSIKCSKLRSFIWILALVLTSTLKKL